MDDKTKNAVGAMRSFLQRKGLLLMDYQSDLFKLIDSIDDIPSDKLQKFTLEELMRLEFFKEIAKEMDNEFKINK